MDQEQFIALLEKVASENGVDVDDLTEEQIGQIAEAVLADEAADGDEGDEAADGDEGDESAHAAAYSAGYAQGQGFMAAIREEAERSEKTASDDEFEAASDELAEQYLAVVLSALDDSESDDLDKVASLTEYDLEALELLDAAGYDVDEIVALLA